jgi:triacylglycerol lipase
VVASADDELTAAAPLGAEPEGSATQYPIVLVHGFLGNGEFANFNTSIVDALEKDGHVVVRASVPPLGSVSIRAKALARDVDAALEKNGATKVNIIAHSMGGLDTRELVSVLGYGDRVASVTTISTPHRGARVADVALGLVAGAREEALDAFGKLVDKDASTVDVKGALRDLAESNAGAFEASHPDDARVYYQSWAGVSSLFAIPNPADAAACEGKLLAHPGRADLMSPILAPAAPIIAHGKADPNDGFVLVSSAKHGNFRGCVPADHADEIGVFARASYNRHTGFDFVRFSRNIAFDLASRGF